MSQQLLKLSSSFMQPPPSYPNFQAPYSPNSNFPPNSGPSPTSYVPTMGPQFRPQDLAPKPSVQQQQSMQASGMRYPSSGPNQLPGNCMMSPGNPLIPLNPYMNIPDGGEFINQPIGQNSGGAPSPFEDIKPRMPPSKCNDEWW